ncbi:MAG: M24 family metallopeptidase [Patescibacteria group bacterium]
MSIQKIRQSCAIATQILRTVVKNLKAGKSEKQVASEIRKLAKKLANGIAFQPIVAFGRSSAFPHHRTTERQLRKSDVVKIDLGVKLDGCCSDITRTFFTAKPTALQRKVYKAVLAAQLLGIRKVKAGMAAKELDGFVRDYLKSVSLPPFARPERSRRAKGDLAKYFTHSTGHGLDRKVHAPPKIGPKSRAVIRTGKVITIEPGVYLKGKFGVRIEDSILVKKNGTEILTHFPKKPTIIKI